MIPSRPPRRFEFHLSYRCGERCAFCSESGRMERWRSAPPTAAEIARILVAYRRKGFEHVTFTGGEPTSAALLPRALAAARRLGLRTYVTTNGGLFAYESYARAVLPLLDELCLSVHGADAATHDASARTPGSFERAVRALENVRRHGAGVFVLTNSVVTRLNWDALEETMRFLLGRREVRHCLVSNVAPEGRAARAYARLAVPLTAWRERVPRLAALFEGTGVALRFFGLPLCVLGGRWRLSNDAHFSPRVRIERRSIGGAPGLTAIPGLDASHLRRRAAACARCAARSACPGVFGRYLDIHGAAGLEAMP
ncbi:MAG: radical SAM protein [Elusimicrobiota bacterium]